MRRALLIALGGLAIGRAEAAGLADHDDAPGLVRPPKPVPDMGITLEDGRRTTLRSLLAGRITALQFVLTGCSSACPMLGALFAQLQHKLAIDTARDFQLVSLSLDPLGDTPAALANWRQRFEAGPNWHTALPSLDQSALVETLLALGVNGSTDRDRHSASVLVIDRQARLVYRSEDFPDSGFMVRALTQIAG
jgi:protein SCO1/2